ncbi:Uncharacterised protein [Mycobacteroides abscessus subsp. abscessus]|nr:Uncharacterised protein [Mycobacteroides abscessus subsp. abscessus]
MRPSVAGSNLLVRCTKNNSSDRMVVPLKSKTATRRHSGPTRRPEGTDSPVSSTSSRTAPSASFSPGKVCPPTVNHQCTAGVGAAGSKPRSSSTRPSSSSRMIRAEVRKLASAGSSVPAPGRSMISKYVGIGAVPPRRNQRTGRRTRSARVSRTASL